MHCVCHLRVCCNHAYQHHSHRPITHTCITLLLYEYVITHTSITVQLHKYKGPALPSEGRLMIHLPKVNPCHV